MTKEKLELRHDPKCGDDDMHEVQTLVQGVKMQVEMCANKGIPIASYDAATKQVYLQHADGRKEFSDGQ